MRTRRWWPSGPCWRCASHSSDEAPPGRHEAPMSHYSITTPIYYVNAEPHIGHTYTTIVADTLARYHRLAGDETFFLTGTDEHGDKIAEAAAAQGIEPRLFADRVSGIFQSTWETLDISFDRFIRTTDPEHVRAVQHILRVVHEKGDIDFREYEGLYCVGCERFLTERDMVEGLCRDHERAPEKRTESNYFFKMSRYFGALAEQLDAHPDWIRPERYRNEVVAMLREGSGLDDLCISRPKTRLDWGIELPFDADYVCYVWFDALINYLAGLGYPDGPHWEERWAGVEHLVAKDILKPHGVFWPCMLMAADLPLYRHLNVHGYWNVDDRKISKSLGNMISPLAMREQYSFDAFRYFLLRDMSFGLDSSFTEEALVTRINADLANNLGNLVSRTLNMTAKFCGAAVPAPGEPGPLEQTVQDAAGEAAREVDRRVRAMELHRALEAIFRLVDATNKYLDQRAPWKAAKQEGREAEVATTLYTCCQALRSIGLLLSPFVPEAAGAILERIGATGLEASARLPGDAASWDQLAAGTATTRGAALFPRIESPEADA
ncbi:MAG: methionine--tRNA ligase [Deltaproteobacteria bacterium]|nr:methionine--tRNA ligase [Deltaproteobacteria bacterium]